MWTKSKGRLEPKTSGSVKRAENQIGTLRNFVEKEGALVSDNPDDYLSFMANEGASITIELYQLDLKITEASYREARLWDQTNHLKEDVNIEYSLGGEKYEFAELYTDKGTHMMFDGSGTDSKLVEAKILDEFVVLPNTIHVGSTLDDVMGTIDIYDGPAYLEIIELKDTDHTIRYHFVNGKVDQIDIESYFH